MRMSEPPQPLRWPLRRWSTTILIVFAGQLVLIFWLSSSSQSRTRPLIAAPPSLHLAGSSSNLVLALADPTLFALPHRQTFSGEAWLTIPAQEFEPFVWTEAAHWLELNSDDLGAAFRKTLERQPATLALPFAPNSERQRLPELATAGPFPTNSTLKLGLGLTQRHLSRTFALRSWPHRDILTNSVVQVLVAGS